MLEGFDLARYEPAVLIVENFLDDDRYRAALHARGYMRWLQLAPNDIYVRPADLRWFERVRARLT